MNFFLRLATCLIVIVVASAGAAMAWDRGDRAAALASPPSTQGSDSADVGR